MRIRRIVLTGLALASLAAPARADIIYTWNEDVGQTVSSSFDVSSNALTTGFITTPDVNASSWSDPFASYGTSELAPFNGNISISMSDGSFTDNGTAPRSVDNYFLVFTTASSMIPSGGEWIDRSHFGYGHWTAAISSVPEPSTLLLSGIAGVFGRSAWA